MVTTMTMPRIVRGPTARRNVVGLGGFYYQLAEQVRERCDNSRSNCAICTPVSRTRKVHISLSTRAEIQIYQTRIIDTTYTIVFLIVITIYPHTVKTCHWKPISSRRSILSCGRLEFVFIPFWIFLYAVLMVLHQCPNDGLFANL